MRPNASSMATELARGALVTAALRSFLRSAQARKSSRPSTGFRTPPGRTAAGASLRCLVTGTAEHGTTKKKPQS